MAVAAALVPGVPLSAEERRLDFADALEQRGYHDMAIFYLQRLGQRSGVPADVREVIPYRVARALVKTARSKRDLTKQQQDLEEARSRLEQFLQQSPGHRLAADANRQLGEILKQRGRMLVIQSHLASNQDQRPELQGRARELLHLAQRHYQAARDDYAARLDELPRRVDQTEEKEKHEAQTPAYEGRIRSALDLAGIQYELAQTYDRIAPKRREHLEEAGRRFEEIHARYRTTMAGLSARMWQGKCLHELGEIGKAIGIYSELLDLDPQGAASTKEIDARTIEEVKQLQDRVLHFRLMCLNDARRKDHKLVIEEARQWRGQNPRLLRSERGMGISWELARAYEAIGNAEGDGSGRRERWFPKAVAVAEEIARYESPYNAKAVAMQERLTGRAGARRDEDFRGAMRLARAALDRGQAAERKGRGTDDPSEAKRFAQVAREEFAEAARRYRDAVRLAEPETDPEEVNQARYMRAVANYKMGRSYDAAVLSAFVARRYPQSDHAPAAAYLALAAHLQAYNKSREEDREADLQFLLQSAELLTERWPDSSEADRARIALGYVALERNDPVTAARWYGAVPEHSDSYVEAQQKAGSAYWQAYLLAAGLTPEDRPAEEQLEQLLQRAREHLEKGITRMRRTLGDREPSYDLLASELSLAQIHVQTGDYAAALSLLEPLVEQVSGSDRRDLAAEGKFVREAYKAALRAYVGAGRLDEAERAMRQLESLETGDLSLVGIYQELGSELQREVDRRRKLGDAEGLSEVLASFEAFLERMLQKRDGQTFRTLHWIGEAYYGMAEGLSSSEESGPGAERVRSLFGSAAQAYEEILRHAGETPGFAPSTAALDAIRLRLVRCRRGQGQFREALELLADLLRENARSVDVQREGAYVFQEWAESDRSSWDRAIYGGLAVEEDSRQTELVWGWGKFAQMLQSVATKDSPYYDTWHEARFNLAYCRYRSALEQADPIAQGRQLDLAEQDIRFTVSLTDDQGGPEWYKRFDRLLRDIQRAGNRRATGLAGVGVP